MLHVSERKQLYAFFAALFSYPDEELPAAIEGNGGVRAAGLFPEARRPVIEGLPVEELQAAFTELFINRLGGAPAPPYGSVYLESGERLMGTSTLSVAEAYRGEGLSVDGSAEPPDYLPTELEFLYFLVECEEKALLRGNVEEARSATRKQADFCRALLHPWVSEFCRRIKGDRNIHPLYSWGATVFERFCASESEWLERMV